MKLRRKNKLFEVFLHWENMNKKLNHKIRKEQKYKKKKRKRTWLLKLLMYTNTKIKDYSFTNHPDAYRVLLFQAWKGLQPHQIWSASVNFDNDICNAGAE